jgi:hypothetical protein
MGNDTFAPVKVGHPAGCQVAFALAVQQNKNAGCYGENCQDHAQTSDGRDECCQSRENEPDAQQQKADIFREFHGDIPFYCL